MGAGPEGDGARGPVPDEGDVGVHVAVLEVTPKLMTSGRSAQAAGRPENVTVPTGGWVLGSVTLTVARKVTSSLNADGLADAVTSTVDGEAATVWNSVADVEAESSGLPG